MGDLVEGLRFYLVMLTGDNRKMSIDTAYNITSYAHQLIHKLDEVKQFNDDYLMTCVEILETRNGLSGIDRPVEQSTMFPRNRNKNVEISGTIYRFKHGNPFYQKMNNKRDFWNPECLICGRTHHTNENRCQPQRVENWVAPGEV